MHSQLTVLSEDQISQVSGGHSASFLPWYVEAPMLMIAVPHMIMGIIEFYNYTAERLENGCNDIEKGDHFAKLICGQ